MNSVGEILKDKRLSKKITLEEVEKITKIKKKFLIAIEENDFKNLPTYTFTRGFLKNYCDFLNLPTNDLIALYRRQAKEETIQLLPNSLIDSNDWPIKITPQISLIFGLAIIFGIFLFYLISQYLSYAGKPYLKVSSPKNYLRVKSEVIEITGKTDPLGKLTINNQIVEVKTSGEFSEKIILNSGENRILISVKNKAGQENEKELRVTYR